MEPEPKKFTLGGRLGIPRQHLRLVDVWLFSIHTSRVCAVGVPSVGVPALLQQLGQAVRVENGADTKISRSLQEAPDFAPLLSHATKIADRTRFICPTRLRCPKYTPPSKPQQRFSDTPTRLVPVSWSCYFLGHLFFCTWAALSLCYCCWCCWYCCCRRRCSTTMLR